MPSVWELRIEGFPAVQAQFAQIAKDLTGPEAARALLVGIRVVQRQAQSNAPRSQYPAFSRFGRKGGTSRPGLLKSAIVSFKSNSRVNPAAFTAVNVLKSFAGGARAPHGHLVHFGTRARLPKRGKVMVFVNREGKYVFARRVPAMPANPFFQKAVTSHSSQALLTASNETAKIIERAVQKGAR